jgi:gamma-glutamyl hercynylcysteine S-oxide synthase
MTKSLNDSIFQEFQQCRVRTLALLEEIDEDTLTKQPHPDFSPAGWHLGHIAYTESLWLLERSAGFPCLFHQYRKLFAADGLPKSERIKLPNLAEIRHYLDTVRAKVLHHLEFVDLEKQERLWRFLLQHESQHCETVRFVMEMCKAGAGKGREGEINSQPLTLNSSPLPPKMIQIPAGEFEMGSDSIDALDNERPAHKVHLETYWIDLYPVNCGQYRLFMEADGYKNHQWWSQSGWEWLQAEGVRQPFYWCDEYAQEHHPVCGVSWYEAEAYARFVGKRLPTEAEWEKAISWDNKANKKRIYPWGDNFPTEKYCNCDGAESDRLFSQTTPVDTYPTGQSAYGLYDALGNVWEWTASWFDGYRGFESYPYVGYSQVYFDGQHRVLKGGSWATRPWAMRSSFRNWYHPGVRQIFAGFRCAFDG